MRRWRWVGCEMKTCTKCRVTKTIDNFHRFVHAKDGRSTWCKSCARECGQRYRERTRESRLLQKQASYRANPRLHRLRNERWKAENRERHTYLQRRSHLKNRYHITPEQYDAMLADQGGGCALCGRMPDSNGKPRLHVDHDHQCCSGKTSCGSCIRGLLCGACNRLLGWYDARQDRIGEYLARTVSECPS